MNLIYSGHTPKAANYTSSDIRVLSTRVLTDVVHNMTVTFNCPAMWYPLFAVPTRLGGVQFKQGIFLGGFMPFRIVTVQNEYATENYYVYRGVNHSIQNSVVTVIQ